MNLNLSINIDYYGIINYTFNCNHDSNFFDLLESISFALPNLNICPCYQIQFNNKNNHNNESYFDVDMLQKIEYYTKQNFQCYKIYKRGIQCMCSQIYKDYFRKSKIAILNALQSYKNELLSKEDEFIKLNDIINQKQKKITKLEEDKSNLNKEKKNLENNNLKLYERTVTLEKEIKDIKNVINDLKKENEKKSTEIKKYIADLADKQKQIEQLIQEKKNLVNNVFKVVEKMNSIGIKNDIDNQQITDLKSLLEKQKELNMIDNQKIKELELENMKLNEEKLRTEKANKDTNFIDFYDVIVDIKSIKDIRKGWLIKMSEKEKAN